jgi:predicted DNA-binding protein (MmcQ/YjbR family)
MPAQQPAGDSPMNQQELEAQCLALPASCEDFPFGDEISVLRSARRCSRHAGWTASHCSSASNVTQTRRPAAGTAHPAIAPGYHLSKRHWNTVTLDGSLTDQMVSEMISDSYELVVASLPKARKPT